MEPDPAPRVTVEGIAARLATTRVAAPPTGAAGSVRAAVAAILRPGRARGNGSAGRDAGPEVLLMERAVRAGDNWSGQVSFPGGREEPHDRDLIATAIRETHEEVGLDLRRAGRLLGALTPTPAMAKGKVLPMTIAPYVFELIEDHPVALGEEAASTFWLPLGAAVRGELDGWTEYRSGASTLALPCWRYDGHLVWGLTFHMLRRLLEI